MADSREKSQRFIRSGRRKNADTATTELVIHYATTDRVLTKSAHSSVPALSNGEKKTIEDRLVAKADAADQTDFSRDKSLGQMSRDERRKVLFGE